MKSTLAAEYAKERTTVPKYQEKRLEAHRLALCAEKNSTALSREWKENLFQWMDSMGAVAVEDTKKYAPLYALLDTTIYAADQGISSNARGRP